MKVLESDFLESEFRETNIASSMFDFTRGYVDF
jgi:hypothetical protein